MNTKNDLAFIKSEIQGERPSGFLSGVFWAAYWTLVFFGGVYMVYQIALAMKN